MPNVVVVNKDRIRQKLELDGWVWSREGERDVLAKRDRTILNAFTNHMHVTVISDDTNFVPQHRKQLQELATISGAVFEIKRFNLPLEECVKRVAARTTQAPVPEAAIRKMAAQYGVGSPLTYPPCEPLPAGEDLPPAIICDLDGTLSLFAEKGHRGPYDASRCAEDDCHPVVRNLLEVHYRFLHWDILYVSGREEQYRPQTHTFFRRHHVPPGALYMRQTGDHRKDWVVKGELFDAHIRGRYDVRFVLDDRQQVVDYWRHRGLVCLQVAPGAF